MSPGVFAPSNVSRNVAAPSRLSAGASSRVAGRIRMLMLIRRELRILDHPERKKYSSCHATARRLRLFLRAASM